MNIYDYKDGVVVSGVKDFLLSQTLECGQCFHFVKRGHEEYDICANNRILHIKQEKDILYFENTSAEEYKNYWENYFDLKRDYCEIKEILLQKDDLLAPAIKDMWGVRLLNQDFFETLISFIISQNQQIPRIKQIIANISYNYGKRLSADMAAFPDDVAILNAGIMGMRECKSGFRAPYIIDACEKYHSGVISENGLRNSSYESCIEKLKCIKGVGDKVANCVALFSLGHRSAFPIDVWIKRIMESLYFKCETSINDIASFAADTFGEYGGYAQQYLFYFAKINEIGKNKRKNEKNQ